MTRRTVTTFLAACDAMRCRIAVALAVLSILCSSATAAAEADAARRPNVVVIVADDLGYGDVGCFGQKVLPTPALDGMAREGMRFTQFYAGAATDMASWRVLVTGRHGGRVPADGTPTMMSVLTDAGYKTALLGRRNSGEPDDRRATGVADALAFIRERREMPFCLVLSLPGPRVMPAQGTDPPAGKDWPEAERRFAAAVQGVDRDVAGLLALLKELSLDRHTLVIFTSDNGPHDEAGHSPDFFDSDGPHRGGRGGVTEGSIRVPMIAWWPGTIEPGGANDRQWYLGDVLATACELAGAALPAGLDSDSFAPALRGQVNPDRWGRKGRLYWESGEGKTAQALRFGKWKAIRSPMFTGPVELYDMSNDPAEKRDYAQRRPDLARHATNLLNAARPAASE